ncbi:MAG: helix-turn-helix domain-containing protein [Alphaproteobacteria bacterium]|mgnify:FL=1|jgi:transcriptional regulator with XRE-family HTH domain|nr:helix-turn-helix domain-containing protein [Alphaproteobacteria bacterium]HJM90495.1 helix-turn-helix domain-containing protein [Alphaproteobacteria bacterium]|tara:strand:- start:1912 stop:2286 length:375 start_codon:yes stop_codon:yes gene_type:complete
MTAGLTPFGVSIRALRRQQGISQKQMAIDLQISAAYLSALERGQRGRPSPVLVDQICGYLNIIWDEADALRRLARLSHPRVVIDTAQAGPEATELANRLAEGINDLAVERIKQMLAAMSDKEGN